ncbi:DNA glycosylase [Hyaloraphidium curvatum]|nr:DNA glycosylase [Hyaloraphidium curvatum]
MFRQRAGSIASMATVAGKKRGRKSATASVAIAYEGDTRPTAQESAPGPPEPAISAPGSAKKARTKLPPAAREPPPLWEKTWTIIDQFRKENPAPVDSMGCERLGDSTADPKAFRFQTLVALMLSSQTKDPVTAQAMTNLRTHCSQSGRAFDVEAILAMSDQQLDSLISKVGFHNRKTRFIKEVARICHERHCSDIPNDLDVVLAFPGVGPKMGHLFMQCAFGSSHGIGVDTHVHRIARRLGWTHTTDKSTPEDTRLELESWLPRDRWAPINPLLVGLGQTICSPISPRCGDCPVNAAGLCPTGRKTSGRK